MRWRLAAVRTGQRAGDFRPQSPVVPQKSPEAELNPAPLLLTPSRCGDAEEVVAEAGLEDGDAGKDGLEVVALNVG